MRCQEVPRCSVLSPAAGDRDVQGLCKVDIMRRGSMVVMLEVRRLHLCCACYAFTGVLLLEEMWERVMRWG